jgi:tetratricopeptide (TPR) repeat protein
MARLKGLALVIWLLASAAGAHAEPAKSTAQSAAAATPSAAAGPDQPAQPTDPAKLERARVLFAQGQAAYRDGRLKQALEHLEQAYELAPSPEIEFDLARIYERVGEPAAAIHHFRAYLRQAKLQDAERQQLEARIATLQALQARQRAQLQEAQPSSEALTTEARVFYERGKKLFGKGRYEGALVAFSAAKRFAALPELTYDLAVTSERLGRTSDAVDYYRAYLREATGAPDRDAVQARIDALLTDRSPRPPSR